MFQIRPLAYASSLDQIDFLWPGRRDAAAVLEMISGADRRDNTSIIKEAFDFSGCYDGNIKDMKIGIPSNYYGEGLGRKSEKRFSRQRQSNWKQQGAVTEEFDMPIVD